MSEESGEIVRKHLDALNAFLRGEISSDAYLALWDEEAEFVPLRAQLEGESYLGHDGLMRFVAELAEDFEEVRFEIEETQEAGDQVVAIGRFRAHGRGSGVDINVPITAVQRVRRGKMLYTRLFSEPAEALEADGLSE
jgi:ketosteroid isomerase-like protein